MGNLIVRAQVLVGGRAEGAVVVLDEPLSMWGGLDPATGTVIDHHHPQRGVVLTGAIVVMPSGRGSSSSSSVLAEAIRLGTAPAGFVLGTADPIVALGVIVARELYGRHVPVVQLPVEGFARATRATRLRIDGADVEPVDEP